MTDRLPPNLLRLFQPRPPLEHLPPIDRAPADRVGPRIGGVADLMAALRDHDPDYVPTPTIDERRRLAREAKAAVAAARVEQEAATWDPHTDKNATSDPFNTAFVGRLNHSTSEKALRREFERYGAIKTIRLVTDTHNADVAADNDEDAKDEKDTKKSRGYAFLEFEREADMTSFVRGADKTVIDGKALVVDVERGRTVKGWRPRRLAGGLGHTRAGPKWCNQTYPGRDLTGRPGGPPTRGAPVPPQDNYYGGGYRGGPGGGGGGFRGGPGGGGGFRDGGFRGGPRGSGGGGGGGFRGGPSGPGAGGGGGGYRGGRDSGPPPPSSRDFDRDRPPPPPRGGSGGYGRPLFQFFWKAY
ncbi:U1 small nuclear ribonucleoprotein of 70kDa MW N terminal-domain-containing protein [Blastocladiella britannica]|nr:U1 small nuclear ribonucleoprotein of 70kDa MW N terminal-domain-containing protein [Blastocladiella britannica]